MTAEFEVETHDDAVVLQIGDEQQASVAIGLTAQEARRLADEILAAVSALES